MNDLNVPDDVRGSERESRYEEQNREDTVMYVYMYVLRFGGCYLSPIAIVMGW